MKIFHWFFIVLLAFTAIIVLAWFSTPPPGVSGTLHPEYQSMLKSGPSVASSPISKWLAYAFGLVILAVFGFCIAIGARRNDKIGPIRNLLIGGFIGYIIIYTLAIFSYWDYVQAGTSIYVLAFPLPTAWVLYGIMLFPLFFMILYIWKFHDWVLTPEDLEKFKRIVEERQQRENLS